MLRAWGRDCKFDCQMRTASLPGSVRLYKVEVFAPPPSGSSSPYEPASEWCSSYECRREFSVPFPPFFAYFSLRIVAETELCGAVWRIAIWTINVLVFASFAFARDGSCSRWTHMRIRSGGARGVLQPLVSQAIGPPDDQAFVKIFHDSSVDSARVLLTFSQLQDAD